MCYIHVLDFYSYSSHSIIPLDSLRSRRSRRSRLNVAPSVALVATLARETMVASSSSKSLAIAAVNYDNAKDERAIAAYRDAADSLALDARDDGSLLARARQYRERADELESSLLSTASTASAIRANERRTSATPSKASIAAGAACVGAVVGAMCLGPVSAVALAGAAAYATTRSDGVGKVARSTGILASESFAYAVRYNEKHEVTTKIASAATSAAERAKRLDSEYGISTAAAACVKTSVKAASEFNAKHGVTDAIAANVAGGLDLVTQSLQTKVAAEPEPPR